VPLLAPTTPPERRRRICGAARGFVYVVSTVGTTGERDQVPPALAELVEATKAEASTPVAVGFGIGTPEQAAQVGRIADGVIIGSRLVRAVADAPDLKSGLTDVRSFLSDTVRALGPKG
jgi:tryptophan synthase alpha chain